MSYRRPIVGEESDKETCSTRIQHLFRSMSSLYTRAQPLYIDHCSKLSWTLEWAVKISHGRRRRMQSSSARSARSGSNWRLICTRLAKILSQPRIVWSVPAFFLFNFFMRTSTYGLVYYDLQCSCKEVMDMASINWRSRLTGQTLEDLAHLWYVIPSNLFQCLHILWWTFYINA